MFKWFAIWYLRKKRCSVMIGCRIMGGHVQPLHKNSYIYDNRFVNVDFLDKNGKKINIPQEGKFSVKKLKKR